MSNRLATEVPSGLLLTSGITGVGGVLSPSRDEAERDYFKLSIHVYA